MRIVIKIGTETLADRSGRIDREQIINLASQISEVKKNNEIIIVSSGAIGCGMGELGINKKPRTMSELQALAAVGQNVLMHNYHEGFRQHNIKIAQLLLSGEDFFVRERYLNMRNTLISLLEMNVVPIINENDSIATQEIKVGDNDRLSAMVAANLESDILIMLSSTDGLYTGDPKRFKNAKLIEKVERITPEIERLAGGSRGLGVGGFKTKLEAAKMCAPAGVKMIIVNGRKENIIIDTIKGSFIGTVFVPQKKKEQRKLWIGTAKPKGIIEIDDGARKALLSGKSLLPAGVKTVKGSFNVGDIVEIKGIAKGIVDYSSSDVERIKGKKSSEINSILGHSTYDAVVRRENMILLI
ncbi:glutamate 5-kinase [Candidatus Woesearchaeota archaeon]|nr:glutamate 5-kinase [Candidatus Woesearchaeota archaeon]